MQTVARRLPPKRRTGPFIDFSVFKSVPFTLYSLSSFLCFLGIYTVRTDFAPPVPRRPGIKKRSGSILNILT